MMTIRTRAALAALLFALVQPLGALHPTTVPRDQDEDEEEEEAEEAKEEEQDRYFALVGGDVHTGTGALLRRATILSKNGVIEEIGYDLYLPEDTEVLDVTGMRVYPGLVALGATGQISSGSLSLEEPETFEDVHGGLDDVWERTAAAVLGHVEPGDETGDGHGGHDDHGDGARPDGGGVADPRAFGDLARQIGDSFDPFNPYLVMALATGITTAEQSGAAVKLRRREIDDVVMNEGNLTNVSWSLSNPASVRSAREKFTTAAGYLREWRAWNALSDKEKKEQKEPKKPKGFDSGVYSILEGSTLARFTVNEREDLLGIARLAQEFHFRPVIFGCREGWAVAEELGRAGALAVVTPRDRSPKDERLVRPGGSSIANAARLHAAGVQVAIRPASPRFDLGGITGRDLLHLPTEAAFGVRGGLSEEAALASISLIPARILGVDHRVGTLEVGKDMDAIVTDGDLLHYETFVQWTVVGGKLVYDKQEEVYFAHIRPRPERPKPAPKVAPEEGTEDAQPPEAADEDADEDADEGDGGGEPPADESSDEDGEAEDGR